MCLVNDRLLSKVTPRFHADDEGGILLPQKTIENLISLLRVANYEEFSL